MQRQEGAFRESLTTIARYANDLQRIEPYPDGKNLRPYWANQMCPPLDAASIYAFVRSRRPRRYLEVGSGNSTRFAAQAVRDGDLATEIISIDPSPRLSVDSLCAEVIRTPLEDTDLSLFRTLEPNDVLFFDCSHRVFTNSDVTVFFLEVLPSLPPGLLLGVHDIFLPDDYPPDWWSSYFSEQYLLSAWLLANPASLPPVLACHYVSKHPDLNDQLGALWDHPNVYPGVAEARTRDAGELGMAFWMTVSPTSETADRPKPEVG